MFTYFAQSTINVEQTKSALQKIGEAFFDWRSLLVLAFCLLAALTAGNLVGFVVRRVTRSVAKAADATEDLGVVNRLRRLETSLIIAIAILRLFLIVFAIYVWWVLTHNGASRSSALLGAGALTAVILGGALTPLLRDFSFGAGMMAEQWFGVGDLISIDFPNVQGVVERITLRSTRIRGLNGEVIWIANQTMNGVRVAKKGVWATAIELFVNDPERVEALIDRTNKLLPGGLVMLVTPLEIVDVRQRDRDIWHVTAIGETVPGRDWILVTTAIDILKKLDSESSKPILHVDPVARFADKEMERQLARAVKNARKTRRQFMYRKVGSSRAKPAQK